jgi:hypothetical protein
MGDDGTIPSGTPRMESISRSEQQELHRPSVKTPYRISANKKALSAFSRTATGQNNLIGTNADGDAPRSSGRTGWRLSVGATTSSAARGCPTQTEQVLGM